MRVMLLALLLPAVAEAAPVLDVRVVGETALARAPVAPTGAAAFAESRIIYLNRQGGLLRPGSNDSRIDRSSIVPTQMTLPGWDVSDAKWAETVDCMREIWAPFAVELVEVDPGNVPHIEARFGGSPTALGLPSNVAGVAPMAYDCSVVENAIVFTFPDKLGNNPRKVCEVMSQEIGHSYGLDHELEASDPMTYLPYSGERAFQDRAVACGESTARPCGIGGSVCRATQNTVQVLLERLGESGADVTAPVVVVGSPRDKATVAPGFVVEATATDDVGVGSLTLYIDGDEVATAESSLGFATDPNLAAGDHELVIEARDDAGNTTAIRREIRVESADHTQPPGDAIDDAVDFPTIGCNAGGAHGAGLIALVLVAVRRRRR